MSRASQADAAKHRDEVVTAAAQLLRERGAAGISVQEVMAGAGLTHGGFYKHFASKDELVGLAATEAFGEILALLDGLRGHDLDRSTLGSRVVNDYLSAEHRDEPGTGCANTALASDSARAPESPLRSSYLEGLGGTIERLTEVRKEAGDSDEADARRHAIETLASLVGALTLARATAGDPLSDELLSVVSEGLLQRW
ncbi:TetR/AcrR family transcriptional regulator [Herbiconiux sp. CPCC 205763]|uniref:TetR/AcrR family transcriptional regulator n=1 Tax=Herbiconiux aconitum TaxID=2970913 RepID=A0ABT2GL12_9MICO|nr:TetR/AcrR family transcriptional regulator [Herbiconiux aconitum]MCS5716906.1 TetR/AcrR family transcriptional regulator [Herbiconiux aconitum]